MKNIIKIILATLLLGNCIKMDVEANRQTERDSCYRSFTAVKAFPPDNRIDDQSAVFLAACLHDANK